jgi:uncharacterized protein (DUF2147 family)
VRDAAASHRNRPISRSLTLASVPAMADDRVVGEWITASQSARVAIAGCADNPALLCGRIAWLAQPLGADDRPARDSRNPDTNLRGRPLLGIDIIRGFRAAGPDRWNGGTIYDPESGRTYNARMRLSAPGVLEVKGCVLIFCEAQTWRRASPGAAR